MKPILILMMVIVLSSLAFADTFQHLYDDPFDSIGEKPPIKEKIIVKHEFTPDAEIIEYSDATGLLIVSTDQIYADSKGTKIHEANSLKNCEFCNRLKLDIDLDPSFNLTIEDYNLTDYTNVCFMSNQTGDIPLRINLVTDKANKIIDTSIRTTKPQVNKWQCYNFTVPSSILDYEIEWGWNSTTVTFSASGKGVAQHQTPTSSSWSIARYGPGNSIDTTSPYLLNIEEGTGVTNLYIIGRGFLPFNTSSLPDESTILSSNLLMYIVRSGMGSGDSDGNNFIVLTANTTQLYMNNLSTMDYSNGTLVDYATEVSNRKTISAAISQQYINFTLNISAISYTNWTRLGLREGHDLLNDTITSNTKNYVNFSTTTLYVEYYTEDISPPSFLTSPYNSTTSNDSATISWTTSETANYTLRYTTTADYTGGTLISNTTTGTARTHNLVALTNYTMYYINVSIWDTSGNYNQSNTSFRTTQNAPAAPPASDPCAIPASCLWYNVTQWCNYTTTYQIPSGCSINCTSTGIMNITGVINFTGAHDKLVMQPGCKIWFRSLANNFIFR